MAKKGPKIATDFWFPLIFCEQKYAEDVFHRTRTSVCGLGFSWWLRTPTGSLIWHSTKKFGQPQLRYLNNSFRNQAIQKIGMVMTMHLTLDSLFSRLQTDARRKTEEH